MRLLVITQVLDTDDPTLSAYHRLVAEIARNFDSVTAICLKKGKTNLPDNVRVLSLGKEGGASRLKYIFRFYTYIWNERKDYDAVFVHMNQEYILLGGIFWKLFGKRIYMWRNHHAGSLLTDIAAGFCTKVFCTSRFSYTAKYKKTVIMPVGIDTNIFKPDPSVVRAPHSILFLGRIAPVKKPDLLIRALGEIAKKNISFTATIVGDPLPQDKEYYESLRKLAKEKNIENRVIFVAGIPNDQTPRTYSASEIFVNLSSSGMYDKTIFEAMACESLVLASNENLRELIDDQFIFKDSDAAELVERLEKILALSPLQYAEQGKILRQVALTKHSLEMLGHKLKENLL